MRVAICGMQIESSTFTDLVADADEFRILRGKDVLSRYSLDEWAPEIDFVGTIVASGGAAGPVDPTFYDALEDEMAERLAAVGPVDGVYLEMHGAMSVLGREGAEESWVGRVRSIVGDKAVISGSFDTHGNLSRELVELIDLAAFHRHAPHIDSDATRERAVRNLAIVLKRGERPTKAWVRIPALLPGERTSTAVEPGASVFGEQLKAIAEFALLDAAMCVGFFWADEARNAAAVLTTGWDPAAAVAGAEALAHKFWDRHTEFQIVSDHFGTWDEAIDYAMTRPAAPLFVSDSGDNVTAGASGDVTFALAATLQRSDFLKSGIQILFAGLWDPHAVEEAVRAGVGAQVHLALGAVVDDRYAGPVAGDWQVLELIGDREDAGVSGALLRGGGIDVSVQRRGAPFVLPDDAGGGRGVFRGVAPVDVGKYDVVVVKNGYLFPGQAATAGSAFMALTPGATDLDFNRIEFRRISRPLYPWDQDITPDLRAEIVQSFSFSGNADFAVSDES